MPSLMELLMLYKLIHRDNGSGGTSDYNDLSNLPQIDSTTLIGNMSLAQLGLSGLQVNTTAYWSQHDTASKQNVVYVFSDYTTVDGVTQPGLKIGDGATYIMDLPFIAGSVTGEDIANWNEKVSAKLSTTDSETLILYK